MSASGEAVSSRGSARVSWKYRKDGGEMPKLGVVTEWVCDVCKKEGSAHGDALPKWYEKEWAVLENPDNTSDTLVLCGRCALRARAVFGWLLGWIISSDVALDIIRKSCVHPGRYSWKMRVIREILWLQSFIESPDNDCAYSMTLVPLVRGHEMFEGRSVSFEQMVEGRREYDVRFASMTEDQQRRVIGALLPKPTKQEHVVTAGESDTDGCSDVHHDVPTEDSE